MMHGTTNIKYTNSVNK